MDGSFRDWRRRTDRGLNLRMSMRPESDQEYGRKERRRAVRPLLNGPLERHGCCMVRQPIQIQHGGHDEDRDCGCVDAHRGAMNAWLLRLLGLAAAGIGSHLAGTVMLRGCAARPASRRRGLPAGAHAGRRHAGHHEPRRQYGRSCLPHVGDCQPRERLLSNGDSAITDRALGPSPLRNGAGRGTKRTRFGSLAFTPAAYRFPPARRLLQHRTSRTSARSAQSAKRPPAPGSRPRAQSHCTGWTPADPGAA